MLAMVLAHHHTNHHHMVLVSVVELVMVLAVAWVLVDQATNHHHTQVVHMAVTLVLSLAELLVLAEVLVLAELLVMVDPLVLVELLVMVDQAATNQHHQAHKYNNMLLMLKVYSLTKTHKSFAVQLPVVYKHTHKTSKFDSFNHHLYHPQA